MKACIAVCFLLCLQLLLVLAEEQSVVEGVHIQPVVKDEQGMRIIGGEDANWKKYPWLAKNVCKYKGTSEWVVCGCGSTMISRHWAVTAGHCIGTFDYKIGLMFSDGDVIEIQRQEVPENYSWDSLNLKFVIGTVSESTADIGLQRLVHPIRTGFGKQILDIINYPRNRLNGDFIGTPATLLGWGATEQAQVFIPAPSPDRFSASLQQITDVVLPNEYCQTILDAIALQHINAPSPFRFTDSLLCAAPPGVVFNPLPVAHVAGLCKGDSGGPLFKKTGWIFSNSIEILGFVSDTLSISLERPCGNGIDIYTKLTPEYLKWIKQIVRSDGDF